MPRGARGAQRACVRAAPAGAAAAGASLAPVGRLRARRTRAGARSGVRGQGERCGRRDDDETGATNRRGGARPRSPLPRAEERGGERARARTPNLRIAARVCSSHAAPRVRPQRPPTRRIVYGAHVLRAWLCAGAAHRARISARAPARAQERAPRRPVWPQGGAAGALRVGARGSSATQATCSEATCSAWTARAAPGLGRICCRGGCRGARSRWRTLFVAPLFGQQEVPASGDAMRRVCCLC